MPCRWPRQEANGIDVGQSQFVQVQRCWSAFANSARTRSKCSARMRPIRRIVVPSSRMSATILSVMCVANQTCGGLCNGQTASGLLEPTTYKTVTC